MSENPFDRIPDIDFAPKTADSLISEMVQEYERSYEVETGIKESLPTASRDKIIINSAAAVGVQLHRLIDDGVKQNLLKYSRGDKLDNLAIWYHVLRLQAQKAVSKVTFTLSAARPDSIRIPKGTRASTANKVFFATTADCVVAAGTLSQSCLVECCEAGSLGNGYDVGQISIIVDPVPYVAAASNTEKSQGGADIESDDSLRYRAYLKPDSFSVAGPEIAYEYFVREYSQAVDCVGFKKSDDAAPGVVDIRITLQGGELPTETFIAGLKLYLDGKRPLTDKINISAPDIVNYSISAVYYIGKSDFKMQQSISEAVSAAVTEYKTWQGGKIGRDIIPDKLTALAVAAGAKRIAITSPAYTVVSDLAICKCTALNVSFGGVESD